MKQLTLSILLLVSTTIFSAQHIVVHLKQSPKNFLVHMLHNRIREGMWDRFKQYEHCLPLHLQYEHFEALQNSCLLYQESLNIVATLRENPSIDNNLMLLQKELDHYMPKAPHEIAMPAHMREGYVPQLHLFVQKKLQETSRAFNIQPEIAIDRVDALRILEMSGTLLGAHVRALQRRTALMDHKEANAYFDTEEKMAKETGALLKKIKDATYRVERLDNGGIRIIKRDAFFKAALDAFYESYLALNETQPCNDPACAIKPQTATDDATLREISKDDHELLYVEGHHSEGALVLQRKSDGALMRYPTEEIK